MELITGKEYKRSQLHNFYGKDSLVSEIWNKSKEKETLPRYQDMLNA